MANGDETQIVMKHKKWWNTNTDETQFGWTWHKTLIEKSYEVLKIKKYVFQIF